MGYIDEKGKWHLFGTAPVKQAYLALMNTEGNPVDANGMVIPNGPELDKILRDIIISSACDPKCLEILNE